MTEAAAAAPARHPLYQKYYAIQYTIPQWYQTISLYKGAIYIGEPLPRARAALAEAREALNDPTLQVVAEDLTGEGGYKRYAVCRWDVLYHYLSYTPPGVGRHCYAMVLPTENPRGFPLMLDLDGPTNRPEFLDDVRRLLEFIRDLVQRESELPAPQPQFLIDDLCHPTGAKQSMHIMCRQIGFRTTDVARDFAAYLKRNVCQWVDIGIPKNEGCYKLPGNWKRTTKLVRAQRPNNNLLELPALTGDEFYPNVVSRDVFDERRPWLSDDELARGELWWPRSRIHAAVAAVARERPVLDWTAAQLIWPCLNATQFKIVYVNEHGQDRFVQLPAAPFAALAQLAAAVADGEARNGTAHHVMAQISHADWLVLWCDNAAARATAEQLLMLAPPVATTCNLFTWYYIATTELALLVGQPAQRARLRESGLLPPSASLSEYNDSWAVLV